MKRYYRIRSQTEQDSETGDLLYWSNEMGWVDRECATVFSDEDLLDAEPLLVGAWVKEFEYK